MKLDTFLDYIIILTTIMVATAAVLGMGILGFVLFSSSNPLHKPQHLFVHTIDTIPISKKVIYVDGEFDGEWLFRK